MERNDNEEGFVRRNRTAWLTSVLFYSSTIAIILGPLAYDTGRYLRNANREQIIESRENPEVKNNPTTRPSD